MTTNWCLQNSGFWELQNSQATLKRVQCKGFGFLVVVSWEGSPASGHSYYPVVCWKLHFCEIRNDKSKFTSWLWDGIKRSCVSLLFFLFFFLLAASEVWHPILSLSHGVFTWWMKIQFQHHWPMYYIIQFELLNYMKCLALIWRKMSV